MSVECSLYPSYPHTQYPEHRWLQFTLLMVQCYPNTSHTSFLVNRLHLSNHLLVKMDRKLPFGCWFARFKLYIAQHISRATCSELCCIWSRHCTTGRQLHLLSLYNITCRCGLTYTPCTDIHTGIWHLGTSIFLTSEDRNLVHFSIQSSYQ